MKESVTYQAILAEGIAKGRAEGEVLGLVREAQKILLRNGRRRLGPPDVSTVARIESLTDVDRLENLIEQAEKATSWAELLSGL